MAHINAPFTKEQVEALNRWQRDGRHHPFTCGSDRPRSEHSDGEGVLVATEAGWICPEDDYTQTWAHDFMVAGPACASMFRGSAGDALRCEVTDLHEVHAALDPGTGQRVSWDPFGKRLGS